MNEYALVPVLELIASGEAELKTGPFGTQLKANEYTEYGTPVINVRNIGFGNIRADKLEFISPETRDRLSSHLLRSGDIVFGRKGAVERHVLIRPDQDGWFQGSDCLRLRFSSPRIEPRFASYFFLTSQHQTWMMNQCSHGATMASLNQGILERIELPIPPLPVQQKIAEVLSAYDELIENNQRRIRILEEMAHSLYREWFVHFRFPGHENHPRVPSSLGEIPQGWERQPVKNILARRPSGNVYHASQPELINGIPIIDQSTSELLGYHANNPDHPASEAHPLAIFGDHTCKMQILFEPFSVGPNVIPFENGIDRPLPYLFYVVRSLVQTQEYKRHWTTLCSKNVVVADKVVAEKFSDAIHPQLRKMSHLQRTNRLLRRTRDLLLPRLLSGQIELEVD